MKSLKLRKIKSVLCGIICICICAVSFTSCQGEKESDSSASDSSKTVSETTAATTVTTSEESSQADSSEEEKEPADITPAMWEVTDKNGTKMTLMGSMHALTENDYPLPEKVMNAYNGADILAVECDPSDIKLNEQAIMLNNMKLADGKTLKDVLSDKGWKGVVNQAKLLGIDVKMIENYKPWAVQNTFEGLITQAAGLDANKGIDSYLLGQAKNSGKEIYQVESAKFQYDLIMNASETVYDIQLMTAADAKTADELAESTKELYNLWRTGDTKKMLALLESEDDIKGLNLSAQQKKELENYNKDMLYNRNKTMEKAIKKLLGEKKNVFYIVGLAHFLGEDGILDLLEKDGYKVTQIKY